MSFNKVILNKFSFIDKLSHGEKQELEKALDNLKNSFEVLVENSNDIIEIVSSEGIIKYISPATEKVFGAKPEELLGKNAFEFIPENEKHKIYAMLIKIREEPKKTVKDDIKILTPAGKEIYAEITLKNQLSEPAINGIVANIRDVTSRVEFQKKLTYIATHDDLTDLPNFNYFTIKLMEMFEIAKEKDISFAVMLIEINDMKYINDTFGYGSGNHLIIEITQRLKSFFGQKAFICRYSWDQFGVIIQQPGCLKDYESTARGIIALFNNSVKIDKYDLLVNVSIGVSVNPLDGDNVESLLKCSNIALLRAKNEGKNKYVFYSSNIDVINYKQFVLRNNLQKSIENNELRVFYQPLVNLNNSDILGAEALVRWEHPDWGMISPAEFIPIAEETGFIINMGKWLLREVCKNYKQWQSKGLKRIKVSVNYSAIQFFEENLVEHIHDTIKEFGLDPRFLIVEITESVLLKYPERTVSNINKLHKSGIQVALDDFGTGYSSLAYLSTLNIDIVKIDRSFIKNAITDSTTDIITRTVIRLVRDLKLKICAEGIENYEQLCYLRKLNCYTGQGYLFNKPVPLDDFEIILRKGKCIPANISKHICNGEESE